MYVLYIDIYIYTCTYLYIFHITCIYYIYYNIIYVGCNPGWKIIRQQLRFGKIVI